MHTFSLLVFSNTVKSAYKSHVMTPNDFYTRAVSLLGNILYYALESIPEQLSLIAEQLLCKVTLISGAHCLGFEVELCFYTEYGDH